MSERFYALIWPHRETVVRTARFLLRDPFEADDLAQETMLKAFRHLERFTDGTDARAWLLSILRNARIDRLRSPGARSLGASLDAMELDPATDAAPIRRGVDLTDPAALMEQFEDTQVIEALGLLPEEIRWTLLLVDVEGLDQADAAKILDIPVGTVKSRTHRGRSMLKEKLIDKARELRMVR